MQKVASSARWQSHTACCGTSPRGINVQGGHKVKEIPNLCSPDNGYSINLRVLFSIHLFPTCVKIPLRRKHGNMNEERGMGVKLVNIHRLEFTMSQVCTTSKHTCTSAKATRGRAQPLKYLWHNLCPSLSSGSAFPLYKSCVRVITGALASCWRKPWWPQHSSALSPRRGSDCCRVCSLAQTQSVSSLEGLGPKSQLERKCWAASFVADKM